MIATEKKDNYDLHKKQQLIQYNLDLYLRLNCKRFSLISHTAKYHFQCVLFISHTAKYHFLDYSDKSGYCTVNLLSLYVYKQNMWLSVSVNHKLTAFTSVHMLGTWHHWKLVA